MSYIELLTGATATNGIPTAVAASGNVVVPTGANLLDGDYFGFTAADGRTTYFEFDSNSVVTDRRKAVAFTGGQTADQVRDAVIAAINAADCGVTASNGGAGQVNLVQQMVGPEGNGAITDAVAHASFVPTAFSGGAVSGVPVRGPLRGAGSGGVAFLGQQGFLESQTDAAVWVYSVAGSAVMTVTVRLWGFNRATQVWSPLGVGTAALKGVLNGGSAIDETSADLIRHVEVVAGLNLFDRLYAEVTAIGGTATAITCRVVH